MDINNVTLERRKKIVSASESLPKFCAETFEYLCDSKISDDEIEQVIGWLFKSYSLEQVDFLVEFELRRENKYHLDVESVIEGALNDGFEVDELKFLLTEKSNFSVMQVKEILKVISEWKDGIISIEKANALIDIRLDDYTIKFLRENIQNVTPAKVDRIIKLDNQFTSLFNASKDVILKAIVEDEYSDEIVSAILSGKNTSEMNDIYYLFKAGLPIELFDDKLMKYCINGKTQDVFDNVFNNCAILKYALQQNIKISAIRLSIQSGNFKKLHKMSERIRVEKETKRINAEFERLCKKFNF